MKTIYLILPFSWQHQYEGFTNGKNNGVQYCKAKKVENGTGYFEENELKFYSKKINQLYQVGNVFIEKCNHDPKGNKIIEKEHNLNLV